MALEVAERSGTEARHEADGSAFAVWPPRARPGLDPRLAGEFASRLEAFRRQYMGRPNYRTLGNLQILDLDQIRMRFGRRWSGLREKIFSITEAAIARRLGPDDLYLVVDERTIYAFVQGMTREEVDVRGRLLAADITQRVLGVVSGGMAVRVRTASFDFAQGLAGVATLSQLRERIDAFAAGADAEERRAFHEGEPSLRPMFQPVLHPRKRLIPAYLQLARCVHADGTDEPASALCPGSLNGVFDAQLDTWSLRYVGHQLRPTGLARPLLLIPLHYETLAAVRLRESYLKAAAALPPHAQDRLGVILHDVPAGMPAPRVAELLAPVLPFTRIRGIRLRPDATAAEQIAGLPIQLLVIDSAGLGSAGHKSSSELTALIALAQAHGLRTMMDQLDRPELLGMTAGIDYLSGNALMPVQAVLGRARRLPRR